MAYEYTGMTEEVYWDEYWEALTQDDWFAPAATPEEITLSEVDMGIPQTTDPTMAASGKVYADPKWGKIYKDPQQVLLEQRNLEERLARTRLLALEEIGEEGIQDLPEYQEYGIEFYGGANTSFTQFQQASEFEYLQERKEQGLLTGVEEYQLSLLTSIHEPVEEFTLGYIDERMKGARHIVQADPGVSPIQLGEGGPKVERGKRAVGKQPFTRQGAQGAQI